MSSRSSLRLERLFDAYSTNLGLYFPEHDDLFICPLCRNTFQRSAITSEQLTIEHVIPSALGGNIETITCKMCNNAHGTKLDAHLVRRLVAEDKLSGKSSEPLNARIRAGGGEFGADVVVTGESQPGLLILGKPHISNPPSHRQATEAMAQGEMTFTMSANLGYVNQQALVAALRSAYLLAFTYFGYGYVLHNNAEAVRYQIMHPSEETAALKGLIRLAKRPSLVNAMGLLKVPAEIRSFVAILNLSTRSERYLAVALPGLGDEEPLYERLGRYGAASLAELQSIVDFIAPNPAYLTNPEWKHLALRLWYGMVEVADSTS